MVPSRALGMAQALSVSNVGRPGPCGRCGDVQKRSAHISPAASAMDEHAAAVKSWLAFRHRQQAVGTFRRSWGGGGVGGVWEG